MNTKVGFVPKKEKAAYFTANMSQQLFQGVIGTFLLLFYTDVVGLNPAIVATLFLISRLLDAVTDPLSGYIIDHAPKTKWGRFRPWLFWGGIATALNFWLIFAGPALFPGAAVAVAFITYLIFGFVVDFVIIPLISLIPMMSSDYDERNKIANMRGIGMIVGMFIGAMATIPVVNMFEEPRTGWLVVIGIYAIIIAAVSMIGAAGVREHVRPVSEENYRFKDFAKILGENRPLWIYAISFILWNIGGNAVAAANIFFFKYNVGDEQLIGPAMMLMLVPSLIGAAFVPALSRKIDKKWLYIIGMIIMSVGILGRFFVPNPAENIGLIFVFIFLTGIGMAPTIPLPHSITADIIDFTAWKHKFHAEGMVGAMTPFISKLSIGVGSAVPGFILAATGYVPDAVQSPEALQGILLATSIIPFVVTLLGALTFIPYTLTADRMQEIRVDLDSRLTGSDA